MVGCASAGSDGITPQIEPRAASRRTAFVGREAEFAWAARALPHRAAQAGRRARASCAEGHRHRREPAASRRARPSCAWPRGCRWARRCTGLPMCRGPAQRSMDPAPGTRRSVLRLHGAGRRHALVRTLRERPGGRGSVPGLADCDFGRPEARCCSASSARRSNEPGRPGRLLLLIDDFHWLDEPSLDLVVEAISELGGRASERGRCGSRSWPRRRGPPRLERRAGPERDGLELEPFCDALELRGLESRGDRVAWACSDRSAARAFASRLRQPLAPSGPAQAGGPGAELRRPRTLVQRAEELGGDSSRSASGGEGRGPRAARPWPSTIRLSQRSRACSACSRRGRPRSHRPAAQQTQLQGGSAELPGARSRARMAAERAARRGPCARMPRSAPRSARAVGEAASPPSTVATRAPWLERPGRGTMPRRWAQVAGGRAGPRRQGEARGRGP